MRIEGIYVYGEFMQIKEDFHFLDVLLGIIGTLIVFVSGIATYFIKKLFDVVMKLKEDLDRLYGEHRVNHKDERSGK